MVRPTRRASASALHNVGRHARVVAHQQDRAQRGHIQAGRDLVQSARVLLELEERDLHVSHTVKENGASIQRPLGSHHVLDHLAQQSLSHQRLVRQAHQGVESGQRRNGEHFQVF